MQHRYSPPLPFVLHVQISDMVTRHKREEITVWASTNSAIMENCQRTVARSATRGRQISFRDNLPTRLLSQLENLFVLLQNGSMPYSFTVKRGLLLLLLFYTGLLPFVPLGESLLQFYLPRIINRCVNSFITEPSDLIYVDVKILYCSFEYDTDISA